MSRSGCTDDIDDQWALIRWRGAVASAIRGKRGQAFLREMIAALDAMPEKRLIVDELVSDRGCCALGAVAIARGLDVSNVHAHSPSEVGAAFGIPRALAAEIEFENDDYFGFGDTREDADHYRWKRMRQWCLSNLWEWE